MSQAQWTLVDDYIDDRLVPQDEALTAALAASAAAGLPAINVSPSQGKLLQLMARMQGARSILEIGTLGGYSTIWLARALPEGGRLVTVEANPHHAAVARANLRRAGLDGIVTLHEGLALDRLPKLAPEAPFDFVFIDADKPNNPAYFDWALALTWPGSVIVFDNAVRKGAILDADSEDPSVVGIRLLYDRMAAEPRVTATAVQTVGAKGYDGFAVALVTG